MVNSALKHLHLNNYNSLKKDILLFDKIYFDSQALEEYLKFVFDNAGNWFIDEDDKKNIIQYECDLDFLIKKNVLIPLTDLNHITQIGPDVNWKMGIKTTDKILNWVDRLKKVEEKDEKGNFIMKEGSINELKEIVGFKGFDEKEYQGFDYAKKERKKVLKNKYTITDKELENTFFYQDIESEFNNRLLANVLSNEIENEMFFPILEDLRRLDPNLTRKQEVISLVVDQFPNLDENLPLEVLVDLKNNKEITQQLKRLQLWITKVFRSTSTPKELNQEIETLLKEYEQRLKYEKLKYGFSSIESIGYYLWEVLEEVGNLNFGTAVSKLFKIKRGHIDFMIGESKAAGREFAFLHTINRKFSS